MTTLKNEFKVIRTLVNKDTCVIRYRINGERKQFTYSLEKCCESFLKIKALQQLKKEL
jgi:hypothetical protein